MPSHQILEQAAEWFALLRSGDATAADQARWRLWLDAAQEHRIAWGLVERISNRLAPVQASADRDSAVSGLRLANRRMARRRTLAGLAALTTGGLLGWAAWRQAFLPEAVLAWGADYRSATGEIRHVRLLDGTQVWLDTGSAFDQDYRADLRRLRLIAGRILIQTAADPGRPFVVDTGQGRLRALGTRFTVGMETGDTFLAVFQGAVEIKPTDADSPRIVQAGQQTRFTRGSIESPAAANPAGEAWARGVLITNNTPLADVARALQRYRGGYLAVAPEIANLPVIGSYPSTDPDRALAMLEAVLPIRVKRTLPWWVSIERKDATFSRQ